MTPSPHTVTSLQPNEVFVFGSNLAVRHGKTGHCYAIPTKDRKLRVLHLWRIHCAVLRFIGYATGSPDTIYLVTPIGCGLAGYRPRDVAVFFATVPDNVHLPQCFIDVLENK